MMHNQGKTGPAKARGITAPRILGLRTHLMTRFSLKTGAFLLVVAVFATPALACTPQQEERLLTGALYREAVMSPKAQAAVATIIFNRVKSGRYGNSVCSVITAPGQFVYRMPARPEPAKKRLAEMSARVFLNEYRTTGEITSHAEVTERLRNYDSFHASYYRGKGQRKGIVIGDNTFYRTQ